MENDNALLVRVLGKKMELNVYEHRVELFKAMWSNTYVADYSRIHAIQFRQPSYEQTGFIKVRAQGVIMDFVTYKTGSRDSSQQISAIQSEMQTALSEIESRVKAARGLPENARLVTYF